MGQQKRKKTLGEAMEDVRKLEGKAATMQVAIGYLRTRYIGRDSATPIAKVKGPDGSPVDEDIIELQVSAWEDEVAEMQEAAVAYRAELVSG